MIIIIKDSVSNVNLLRPENRHIMHLQSLGMRELSSHGGHQNAYKSLTFKSLTEADGKPQYYTTFVLFLVISCLINCALAIAVVVFYRRLRK